jgi:dihydropteroate synthase
MVGPAGDSSHAKQTFGIAIIENPLAAPERCVSHTPRCRAMTRAEFSTWSWRLATREVTVERPFVIGILNITPDSFSDGGRHATADDAVRHADRMIREGADGIDIGGESTRPHGAVPVSAAEETQRVLPVLRAIRARFAEVVISVDTTKSEVAEAALDGGAEAINDVSGLRLDPRLGDIVASARAGLVLMHSRGGVAEMGTYRFAEYGADVVGDIVAELRTSIEAATGAGVDQRSIVIDPGIGFAKQSAHSLRVIAELGRIAALGFPVMVGVSRKRFVGELSGVNEPERRVAGTVGANVAALMRGARVFRVHDVAENRQALDVAWGVLHAVEVPPSSGSQFPVPGSRHP